VLDINMPRLDGIETTKRIHNLGVLTQVLILSMYSDESLVKKAFHNGARGYMLKQSVTDELLSAVRATGSREYYISPSIVDFIDFDDLNMDKIYDSDPYERLTPRERDVFKLVAEGRTNTAIAVELGISVKTVEKHRSSLMEKMGIQDMAGLIREAIKHGLVFLEG
jgi:DNA-binding NarL/FixJ family response regulator